MEPTDFQSRFGMRLIPIALALAAVGMTMIRGCHEGPFGRKQVFQLSADQENELGAQSFQQVLQQAQGNVLPDDSTIAQEVKDVAKRLVAATQKPEFLAATKMRPQSFTWSLKVIRSNEQNAFCLPGGKIVVYTGILPIAERDSGLATVLAHEIGHALAHHGAERMAQNQMAQTMANGAAASASNGDPNRQQAMMGMMNQGAQYAFLLPHGRGQESEADHIGLLLMSAAGYDPNEAIRFWHNMERLAGSHQPEFLSTHPSHERRVRDLQAWLDQAEPLYQQTDPHAPDNPLPLR